MPFVDYKFCSKCSHCIKHYRKLTCSESLIGYMTCNAIKNPLSALFMPLYVYPHIINHKVEAPKECQFYTEMCLQDWQKN